MFDRIPHLDTSAFSEKKRLEDRLNAVSRELKNSEDYTGSENNRNLFLTLFKDYAQQDVGLGIAFLRKMKLTENHDGKYGSLSEDVIKIIAIYDPVRATKLCDDFINSDIRESKKQQLLSFWKEKFLTKENAQAVYRIFQSHTPDDDFTYFFKDHKFRKKLLHFISEQAISEKDYDTALDLARENTCYIVDSQEKDLQTHVVHTLRDGQSETNSTKLKQLGLDGITVRIAFYQNNLETDVKNDLDQYTRNILEKLSISQLWEMSQKQEGALKQTLEEECVLRVAKTDPEKIFDVQYTEIIKRDEMKTLLAGVVHDQSILDRIGKPSKIVYGNTAYRHFDSSARAAMIFAPGEQEYVDEKGFYDLLTSVRYNKALKFASEDLKRHPEHSLEIISESIVNLDKQISLVGNGDVQNLKMFAERYPEQAIVLLKDLKNTEVRESLISGIPKESVVWAFQELFEQNPAILTKEFGSRCVELTQADIIAKHVHELPPAFVKSFFENEWNQFVQTKEKNDMQWRRTDIAAFWNGVKKHDPQYPILHDQLISQFGVKKAENAEQFLSSEYLETIRFGLLGEGNKIIAHLLNLSREHLTEALEQLRVVAETVTALNQQIEFLDPEQKKEFDVWRIFRGTILRSFDAGIGHVEKIRNQLADERNNVVATKWGNTVGTSFIFSIVQFQRPAELLFEIVNSDAVSQFHALVSEKTFEENLIASFDAKDQEKETKKWEAFSNPALKTVIDRFPWFESMLANSIGSTSFDLIFQTIHDAQDGKDPEEWLGKIAVFCKEGSEINNLVKEFPKYDAAKLAHALEQNGISWKVIRELPNEHIALFKDSLIKAAEKEKSQFGSKLIVDYLRRISKSPEQYVAGLQQVNEFLNRLNEIQTRISYHRKRITTDSHPASGEYEQHEQSVQTVVGAIEEIGNTDLRTKIEDIYFARPLNFKKAFLDTVPKDAHVSLPILADWYIPTNNHGDYTVTSDSDPEMLRFIKVLYSGQVFKKKTDLERFQYFLVEAQKARVNNTAEKLPMRSFLDYGTRFMEHTSDAKKHFFGITQQLRCLGILKKELFSESILEVCEDLREVTALIDRDINLLEVSLEQKKDFELNIDVLQQEVDQIDDSTEKGKKQKNKLLKKIEDQKKKFAEESIFSMRYIYDQTDDSTEGKKQKNILSQKIEDQNKKFIEQQKQKKILESFEIIVNRLETLLRKTFEESSGIKFSQKDILTFFEIFQQPANVFLYIGKLKESEDKQQQELFRKYLTSVVHGGFPGIRYALERKHLDKVFADREEEAQLWTENISFKTVKKIESESDKAAQKRLEGFVSEALNHEHLTGKSAELLKAYFAEPTALRKQKKDELESKISEMKKKGNTEESVQEFVNAQNVIKILSMTPDELKADGEVDSILESLINAFKQDHPFSNDLSAIQGIVKSLRTSEKQKGEQESVVVEETEDPEVMLRMGSDVAGSCQRLDGTPDLNKNLISYLMDGKIKVLIVRDASNVILGRALLRVLYDEKNQTPVLQLERSYHRDGTSAKTNTDLLIQVAKQRAEMMGYPLVGTREYFIEGLSKYPEALASYGGPGSTEYVDSGGGQRANGIYELSADSHVVLSVPKKQETKQNLQRDLDLRNIQRIRSQI